jgi:hypothetical protein
MPCIRERSGESRVIIKEVFMNKKIAMLIAFVSSSALANQAQEFTISEAGVSDNTGTVFINTIEAATNTECSNPKQFKVALDNRIADRFYSTALMALASNKKITIYYESNICIDSGTKVNVAIVKS